MPVAILCGYPCSGKSLIARELQKTAREIYGIDTVIVSLESVRKTPKKVFSTPAETRSAHALLRAETTRHLSKTTLVILDFYNYIKGFRYEIYCAAKELGTPSCCIWCNASMEECWERNDKMEIPRYTEELFEDISTRFEVPIKNARWDSPLFTISGIKDPSITEDKICEKIIQVFITKKAPLPPKSTKPPEYKTTNKKILLSESTLNVTREISDAVTSGGYHPGELYVTSKFKFKIPSNIHLISPARLNDMRRRFLKMREGSYSSSTTAEANDTPGTQNAPSSSSIEQDFCNYIKASLEDNRP